MINESIRKSFTNETFKQREFSSNHHTYDEESELYECIRQGDKSKIQPLLDMFLSERVGKLSDNPLMNCRYHFVSAIAIITRITISCGVEHSACYMLSDIYIQKMDKCNTIIEIQSLYKDAIIDFVNESAKLKRNMSYPKPVRRCIDYIYSNLHDNITVAELSKYCNVTPTYLSSLFKKETGFNITVYIHNKKIDSAKEMLKYSDYSCSEISSFLSFSSASHFVSVFRKITGMTPNQYKKCYSKEALK